MAKVPRNRPRAASSTIRAIFQTVFIASSLPGQAVVKVHQGLIQRLLVEYHGHILVDGVAHIPAGDGAAVLQVMLQEHEPEAQVAGLLLHQRVDAVHALAGHVVVEDDHDAYFGEPPTKLENPKLFKPFEMYVKMYGLPAYGEMDPTWFVAITYSFIFGAMFGDAGQGLLLFIGGLLLYKLKHIDLAGIISCAGIFSTFFGFMFGSVFGFEDIIEPVWLRPMDAMMNVPFIGKLNTVFIVSIAFGMGIILISMIFHIINGIRAKDTEATWFDANGVAGLIFYGAAVTCIVLFMTGHSLPGGIVLAVMFGVPLLLIALKEPLTNKIKKKTEKMEQSKAMFVTQAFFELFETLLSYFSNTLSFIRIGAFAVSHASIMEVVLMLAGAESGHINWVVIVLGNLFVCGFEGLIVGIQVLRLVYYEMFSRFYKGSGREFKPYTGTAKN